MADELDFPVTDVVEAADAVRKYIRRIGGAVTSTKAHRRRCVQPVLAGYL
jgi:hypothetical protein